MERDKGVIITIKCFNLWINFILNCMYKTIENKNCLGKYLFSKYYTSILIQGVQKVNEMNKTNFTLQDPI